MNRRETEDVPLLTVAQAATHARVDRRTIGRWIKAGLLLGIPDGNATLIPMDHLQLLVQDRNKHFGGRLPVKRHTRDA